MAMFGGGGFEFGGGDLTQQHNQGGGGSGGKVGAVPRDLARRASRGRPLASWFSSAWCWPRRGGGHASRRVRGVRIRVPALRALRAEVGGAAAVLGFVGSPWTLATYLIEVGCFPGVLHVYVYVGM